MNRLFILFLVLLSHCSLPFTPSALWAGATIKVGIYDNKPLIFVDADGRGRGVFADILEHVASKEGWRIDYWPGTFEQGLSRLRQHQIDMLCNIAFSKDRDKLYDFNQQSLLTNWGHLYTPSGSDITTITDLMGKNVAALKEDVHYAAFTRMIKNFGITCKFIETNHYAAVLDLVSSHQADAGIVNRFFGMKHEDKYDVDKSGVIFNPIKIHYAVPQGKNKALIATLDRYIKQLKSNKDSVYYRSLDRWFEVASPRPVLSPAVKWSIAFTLGLIVFLFLGNLFFRNRVRSKTRELTVELQRRKQTEKALVESEQRFRELAENIREVFWVFDCQQQKVLYVSPTYAEIWGRPLQSLLNNYTEWSQSIHPEDRQYAAASFEKIVKTGGGEDRAYRIVRPDGAVRWVSDRGFAVYGKDGTVQRIVGSAEDITEKKHTEEALRQSEEKFRSLVEESPLGISLITKQGRYQYINPSFQKMFGYTLEDVPTGNEWFKKAFPDKGARKSAIKSWIEDQKQTTAGQAIARVFTVLCKDGSQKIIHFRSVTLENLNRLMIYEDITEKSRMERQLQQAQKFEAIGTLAGGIAHDFNNLLMGIQGRASLMAVDLEPSDPQMEHTHAIQTYIRSATDLTKQLLGFAQGGKYEVRSIDLNELVQGSATMFGRTKKEIQIHTKLQDPPPVVSADRSQIEQALLNMYVNAWQAMPQGGKLYLETKIVMLDDAHALAYQLTPGRYAKISVTDTGIGIDAAIRQKIFDPFFTTKAKGRGTGLGLASAYGIIKNHGGIVTVYSEPGHGTTFNIYLPVSDESVPEDLSAATTLIKGSETVLLVDDETMILEVGQAMLEKLGYRVIAAQGGQQAVDAVRKAGDHIDLVILDMIMPGVDGGKAFDLIRAVIPAMPVLLSSGYSLNGQAHDIIQRGCNGFIQKPFNIYELSQKIRTILEDAKGAAPTT